MPRSTTLALLALLGLAASAGAQGRAVRLDGRVLWIAGQTLVLEVAGNPSVRINLAEVPQSDYRGLRAGDQVVVTGAISDDYLVVNGRSISRRAFDGTSQSP